MFLGFSQRSSALVLRSQGHGERLERVPSGRVRPVAGFQLWSRSWRGSRGCGRAAAPPPPLPRQPRPAGTAAKWYLSIYKDVFCGPCEEMNVLCANWNTALFYTLNSYTCECFICEGFRRRTLRGGIVNSC